MATTKYLRYGNHARPVGECNVAVSKKTRFNDAMQEIAVVETWNITGMLLSRNGDLQQSANQLITAFGKQGQNATWFNHSLTSSQALGGVRVVSVDFPDGGAGELAVKRTYQIVLEAEFPVSGAANLLISFEESLDFSGGDSVYGFLEPINGPPVEQLLRQQSVYAVVQSGSAVGYGNWPNPLALSPPMWPSRLMEKPRIKRGSAKRRGGAGSVAYTEYPVSWTYVFRSPTQLTGNPHNWPANS